MSLLPLVLLLTCSTLLSPQQSDTEPADETAAPPSAAEQGPRPTLAEIFSPPDLLGLRPSQASLSADGQWALYRWTAEHTDEPERDWWLANTATGERRVLFTHEDDVSLQWAAEGALLLVSQDGWIDTLDVSDDSRRRPLFEAPGGASLRPIVGQRLLISAYADRALWLVHLQTGARRKLSEGWERSTSRYEWERDSGTVAFFARAIESGDDSSSAEHNRAPGHTEGDDSSDAHSVSSHESADTSAPSNDPRLVLVSVSDDPNRLDDLVVEVSSEPSSDLSPDRRWVSLTTIDYSSEHELIMADYLTEQVTAVPVRGSLAGDPASEVGLSIHDVTRGETFEVALDQADRYSLRRTAWSPDSSLLLVDRISEDSHVRQVLIVDPATRRSRVVFADRDEAWIGAPTVWSGWSEDSRTVLLTSERSGFNHLYRVDASNGDITALTSGDWEIQRVTTLDDDERLLLSSLAVGDPASMELQLIDVRNGDSNRLVGELAWASRPMVSADGGTVLYRYATLGRPWDLHALAVGNDLAADSAPVQLSDTVPDALTDLALPAPELITYTNPDDGAVVHAYLYKPVPFDPDQTYPAVMFIHGAGQLQQVRNSMSAYEVNMLFHHRLARQGFVVIDPDYRHSNGYGRDFRAAIHGHMGGKDVDDALAGIDYLDTLGYVDTDNVGIYGGSYGGFMVLMALFTHPDAFAAGAALRSVTDWRTYNHWYTNPRLGLPDDDPEAYERSSPIDHVEGLQNPLLLLHGLKDNNVFAQDSIRLMEKMIELGKDFDVMLYPSQGHGFTDPASWIDEYKRIERLFLRELRD